MTGLADAGQAAQGRALLARLGEAMSPEAIPPSFPSLVVLAEAYSAVGDREGMARTLRPAEEMAVGELLAAQRPGTTEEDQQRAFQYVQFIQAAYARAEAYDELSAFFGRLADALGDPELRMSAEEIRRQMAPAMQEAPAPAPGPDSGAG